MAVRDRAASRWPWAAPRCNLSFHECRAASVKTDKPIVPMASLPPFVDPEPPGWIRRLAPLFVTICFILVLAGGGWYAWKKMTTSGRVNQPAEAHWTLAHQLLAVREYARARQELSACLDAWPLNAEANYLMARVCRQEQDFTNWEAYIDRASQLQWSPTAIGLEQSLRQAQAGFPGPVEQPLLQHMKEQPADAPLVYEALAQGYKVNRRYRELWQLAAAWTDRFPNDWLGWRYRGDAFYLDGGASRAIAEYEHALQCAPDPNLVRPQLAAAYSDAGHQQEALAIYQDVLKDKPDDPRALFGTAVCQNALANEAGARAALAALLHVAPEHVSGMVLKAKLDLNAGHARQALELLQKAEKLTPWRSDVLNNLISALQQMHQTAAAKECARKLKGLNQNLRDIYRLQKELHKKPRDITVRYQIAELYRQIGNNGEAVRWYSGVLAIDPTHAASRRAMIELLGGADKVTK
jgi:tetratricopeptide (TPR) repeat protein